MTTTTKAVSVAEAVMAELGAEDAVRALVQLGYKRPEAFTTVCRALRAGVRGTSEIIVWTLANQEAH